MHDMDRSDPGHATVIDGKAVTLPDLYHPTFLYEALWDLGVADLVFWLDRKFKFGKGRAFAIYVMAYTARPLLDRDPARRRGQPLLRRTAERLHLRGGLPRRAHLLHPGQGPPASTWCRSTRPTRRRS
nr:hypothetical protein GCM10020092_085190 [Actinoplanes digitatis]